MTRRTTAAIALLLAACRGEPEPLKPAPPPPPDRVARAAAGTADTSGHPNLPGPPSVTPVPTSSDPEVRRVEDRLYRSDGGRVVLKAIRASGGWKRWMAVEKLTADVRPEGGAPSPVSWSPADPEAIPDPGPARTLAAPFWLASPALRLEYLGVEADAATGRVYDKVRVFEDVPGTVWRIAYFDRMTSLLDRVLEPRARGVSGAFSRTDLDRHEEAGGLLFARRWTTFALDDLYARARKPESVADVQVGVVLKTVPAAP